MTTAARRRVWITVGLTVWLLTIGSGLALLWAYAGTPGPAATAHGIWPAGAGFARNTSGPSLLVFLHPQCPCSRATLGELARLLASPSRPAAVYALVYRPVDEKDGWERTDLWDTAAAMKGVHVMTDVGGAQARVFGALVSGQTLLYGASGSLLFSGGITDARGHEGDNPGRTAVTAILAGVRSGPIQTPVFGCVLYSESDVTASRQLSEQP